MKTNILFFLVIVFLIVVFFVGCFEEKKDDTNDNNIEFTGDTYTWDIERFMQDYNVEGNITAWELYGTGIAVYFDTLEDGDTLIIEDEIPDDIEYYSDGGFTVIPFSISYDDGRVGTVHNVFIDGDITDEFSAGDDFVLTVHIKHINVTAQNFMGSGDSIRLDWELFYEQLNKGENFFKTSLTSSSDPFGEAIKPMDGSVIVKE